MDYRDEAIELVEDLNQRLGPSAYDSGWLARLCLPGTDEPRWPDLLDWLLENQWPDGSWGGKMPYYHDRIICTLSAAIALRENGHRRRDDIAIKRAEKYLWGHLHLLNLDLFELVGFELIFPTLLATARSLGLSVPEHTYGYDRIRAAKLRLIPPELLYSSRLSVVHSLEFLGPSVDKDRLRMALAENGSLGNSPAATAFYLSLYPDDESALGYLEGVREHLSQIIYLYPCQNFELTWVLNNMAFCDAVPLGEFASPAVWQNLRNELSPIGIGLDSSFGVLDGDITSVTTRLLIKAGYDVDSQALSRFENKEAGLFRTYEYERNVSVGTNVHALEAMTVLPNYPNKQAMCQNVLTALLAERKYNLYWIDKWHISPMYATSHVVVALIKAGLAPDDDLFVQSVLWFLHTQREDGSWGFFQQGTLEETAYVLTALLHYHRAKAVDVELLHRGAAYLQRNYRGLYSTFPELWIGKCLYVPHDIVRAAVLAALILYESMFGRIRG